MLKAWHALMHLDPTLCVRIMVSGKEGTINDVALNSRRPQLNIESHLCCGSCGMQLLLQVCIISSCVRTQLSLFLFILHGYTTIILAP